MLALAKNDESDVVFSLAEYIAHLMRSSKCEKQINFITENIESILFIYLFVSLFLSIKLDIFWV